MNQSLNMQRWWLLVAKHWSENRKKYSLSLAAIAGLLLLWFIVILVTDSYRGLHASMQNSSYFVGLFLGGCLYASILFADLGSKTRGLNYLEIPASHLEKLLSALFYCVVLYFAAYTAIFYMVDIIMVKSANATAYNYWVTHHTAGDLFEPQRVVNIFSRADNGTQAEVLNYLLLFYFVLQAAFILGSIYFARFTFIKTVISLLLVSLCLAFIAGKILSQMMPPGSYYHGVTAYQVLTVKESPAVNGIMIYSDAATDKLVTLPEWINDLLLFLLKYAFAPLFWLATYYRLKEKEI